MLSDSQHIAFCVNNKYARYIAVTIKSIAENNHGSICIHILTDYISKYNRKKLFEIIKDSPHISIQIYNVDDTPLSGLKTGRWTIYAWYRLLLPEVLSKTIKKALYLDADTLVVSDLKDFFATDMTGLSIAATLDYSTFDAATYKRCGYDSHKQYICDGVMLINLEYWRKNQLAEKIILWAKSNETRLEFPDQDSINYICQDTKIILPFRYGITQSYFTDMFLTLPYLDQIEDCVNHPAIIHYGNAYPWIIDNCNRHVLHDEWIKYNKKLPHPVKRIYKARGWLLIKMRIWNMFHHPSNNYITINDIRHRLQVLKSVCLISLFFMWICL